VRKHAFVLVLIFVFFSGIAASWSQKAETVSFSEIAGIMNTNCVTCHAGNKPADGLRLDSYENIIAGAKHGPVVVAGHPEKSGMVSRVKGTTKPRMPMNGPPWLSKEDTATIEAWIAAGAQR
jgi:mono/diheme cytochrome c family protein